MRILSTKKKKIGELTEGCMRCIEGKKLVLFITGVCPRRCFYCPVSDHKDQKDVIFANETPIDDYKKIIEEVDLCESNGAGITGGDPLARLDRTLEIITLLKNKYGADFHIHLYTSFNLVTKENMEKLYDVGLNEIRFHADFDKKLWENIEYSNFGWKKGIEIPCVPGKEKETLSIIEYFKDKVDFFNLNELEIAENKPEEFKKRGLVTKNDVSYAIKGSKELALKIINYYKNSGLNIHYCSAAFKDKIQMGNRLKHRSNNVKLETDIQTEEGTLIRGCIYLNELKPGFGYQKKVKEVKVQDYVQKLNQYLPELKKLFQLIHIDEVKPRFLVDADELEDIKDKVIKLGLIPAIVEEYPTYDRFEIEVEFL